MLRKRYLTIHDIREAKARTMSMLSHVRSIIARNDREVPYSVVAFIVTVRVVENNANRTVGSVIVEKVISQTSVPGTALAMTSRPCPKSPSHVFAVNRCVLAATSVT